MPVLPRLTDEDVRAIRRGAIDGGEKSAELAAHYGVDAAYVRRIVRGEVRAAAGGPTRNRRRGAEDRPAIARRRDGFLLDAIPDMLVDEELEIVFPYPPEEHVVALMRTLGVAVAVEAGVPVTVRRPRRGRSVSASEVKD